jgi:hypothetical protein
MQVERMDPLQNGKKSKRRKDPDPAHLLRPPPRVFTRTSSVNSMQLLQLDAESQARIRPASWEPQRANPSHSCSINRQVHDSPLSVQVGLNSSLSTAGPSSQRITRHERCYRTNKTRMLHDTKNATKQTKECYWTM